MYGRYHYHQIFRKSIIAFGTLFNNIIVKRKDPKRKEKNALESYKVPCLYGPYQKYLAMIASEPNAARQEMQISLPRISFEIKGLSYDGSIENVAKKNRLQIIFDKSSEPVLLYTNPIHDYTDYVMEDLGLTKKNN